MPVGELMVCGPLVMLGYHGNEQATAATIEPDGWLHTGDIATMDADGYFTIVDRVKDMILTAGFNVYPAEIERVLCGHRPWRWPPSVACRTSRKGSWHERARAPGPIRWDVVNAGS